jgi:hypothetical protein
MSFDEFLSPSEQFFAPNRLSVEDVRKNVGTPFETTLIKEVLFGSDADAYILLMQKYHNFMYLFTHDFNRILKSQFQRIFQLPESTARALLKRLSDAKIIEDNKYAGNYYIYPLYRGFRYSAQNFKWDRKVPNSINKNAQENTLLNDFHRVEYWLRTDTVLSNNLDFFKVYESIFLPKELLQQEKGFDYHFDAFEWVIKEELKQYKNRECQIAFTEAEQLLNREVPVISKKEAIAKANPHDVFYNDKLKAYMFKDEDLAVEHEKLNQSRERYWRMDREYQRLYYNIIMKTLLTNLSNKNAYVIKIRNTKVNSEIDIVVLHTARSHWSTYNNLITQFQRIYCFQTQSLKINITVVAENKEDIEEAKLLWGKAIEERERKNGVNFERRARKNAERKKKGLKLKCITINDLKEFVMKGTKYCNTNEVNFFSLQLDDQFTNEVYRVKPERKLEKKSFNELMKARGSV